MLVLTFNQFRKDLEHYQELIEQKNQDLEEASEEIRAQRDDLQEANQEIQNKSEEILSQRDMLEQTSRSLLETNRNLTDSINYAKRIQDGLSPMREVMNKSLPEHFVLLLPRDVVSGDAVYYREMEGYYVMASVDCTGHGVPGSLMTMMMYTIMDQLVVDFQWRNPAEILERLHINLRRALGNAGGKQTDGMDMAIVIQDEDDSTIHYSGAKHPLFYWSKEEGLQYQKGTPRSVGDPRSQHIPFQAHSFKMKPNTSIYLFSDGYADQFGGPNGRKFMRKRFRKLIEESGHLPMLEQKEVLHNSILKWTNQWSYSQVDDILVIGAKVT